MPGAAVQFCQVKRPWPGGHALQFVPERLLEEAAQRMGVTG